MNTMKSALNNMVFVVAIQLPYRCQDCLIIFLLKMEKT